ncbi:hypothetical protein R1sor_027579 [Riccia sorocarpa]|uniref:Uncharacterized protein n=1 Tax=Riccia sorocarpa TaxID=122646 RepID=A0ABD3GG23_9MARC
MEFGSTSGHQSHQSDALPTSPVMLVSESQSPTLVRAARLPNFGLPQIRVPIPHPQLLFGQSLEGQHSPVIPQMASSLDKIAESLRGQ